MYTESDVHSAVEAGAISTDAAEALRAHVALLRAMPAVDEEQFRLVTGFNDIFVSIACLLVIFAAVAAGSAKDELPLGGLLVAIVSWAMAEMFTRRRRMALPSIILLLAFVIGLGFAASQALGLAFPEHAVTQVDRWNGEIHRWQRWDNYPWEKALMALGAAVAAGLGAMLHWRRFHVAITIAAAVGAFALLVLASVAALRNEPLGDSPVIAPAALACGLAIFAYAMWWDASDRIRTTQRADIAFWLHLVAAPLIAHPLFYWMGVMRDGNIGPGTVLGVLAIYVAFAVIALAVDRRALLVSALAYVIAALAQLFRSYGSIELNMALTTLVIGSALLALSAWWSTIRRVLVRALPEFVRIKLPPIG
jgi:hypothetical protein